MRDVFRCSICLAAAMMILLTAPTMQAHAQEARIENEYKLAVPGDLTDEVWAYLQQRYLNVQDLLSPLGGTFHASFADERHVDQYFDTPQLTLLHMHGGIRHRTRSIITGEDFAKDGRQLVQVKLNRPGEQAANRTEIKFPVRRDTTIRKLQEAHPVVGLIREPYREEFRQVTRQLGIDAGQLAPSLKLDQRRRRVYITRDGESAATITLDVVRTGVWYRTARFTELEIELNEIAYTEAGHSEREAMQFINDAIKQDILRVFPEIAQDQTPKYNKAFNAMSDHYLWYPMAHRLGMPLEVLEAAAGMGVLIAGYRFMFPPRRRFDAVSRPLAQAHAA